MSWVTKKLNNFVVDFARFVLIPDVEIRSAGIGKVEAVCFNEGFEINGVYNHESNQLLVDEITQVGPDADNFHKSFLYAIQNSTGLFEAVLIHKDKISATKLRIDEGSVEETKVDL